VAYLSGKIFSAIRHGIINPFFEVILRVEMPHVVTSNDLVSGFMTSPVGAHSSVNVSDYVNDFRFQRHEGSSSQLDSPTEEQPSADWLSQRSVLHVLSLHTALFSVALSSTFVILRNLLSAAVAGRQGQQGLLCWPKHNQNIYFFLNIFSHKYVFNYSPE